jgi:hypothetical protein
MFQRACWIAALTVALVYPPTAAGNSARILESSHTEIILELATDSYSLTEERVGGESFVVVEAPGLSHTDDPGLPRLPKYAAVVAVPFGSRLRLEVLSTEPENLGRYRPIPAPHEDIIWDGEMAVPTQEYIADAEYYRSGRTYPPVVAELGAQGTLRHQRLATVIMHPFQHAARTGTLTLHRKMLVRLVIESDGRPDGLRSDIRREEEWERTYDRLLLNPEQAREWRRRPSPRRPSGGAQARSRQEAYRILTTESGMHRVDYAALSAAGLSSGIPVDDIAVYQRSFDADAPDPFVNSPLPILVVDVDDDGGFGGEDYVLFQARSFEEQFMTGGYEDRYGDENAYWLAEDADLAMHMSRRPGSLDDPGLEPPVSFRDTVRFEEDVYFYARPDVIELDLYHWTSYTSQGDSYDLPFALYGIIPDGDIRMKARYQGMTSGSHSVDLRIAHGDTADNFVGRLEFSGITRSMSNEIFESAAIPAWYIADGENRLRTGGTTGPSGANLDWFQFEYDRLFEAHAGRLSFTSAGETGDAEFSVGGFESQEILLFDVTDPANTVEILLTEDNFTEAGGDYTLSFQDDVGGFTCYEAVQEDGYLRPVAVERRDPGNLHSDEADVIVITHQDFAGGIDPLVSLRESQGWSVAVARVGEVYDEFGSGLKSTRAIKDYLDYAFREWSGTPQFVLLVGDASEDTRGLSGVSQPDYIPTVLGAGSFSYPQMTASDQWYISSDEPDLYLPQMFIGRLPVSSVGELNLVVSKILSYENEATAGEWRDDVVLIADDQWKYGEFGSPYYWSFGERWFTQVYVDTAVGIAPMLTSSPAEADSVVFALRRYTTPFHDSNGVGTETQPFSYFNQVYNFVRTSVTPEAVALLSRGAAIVNFQGHGNRTQMTHEQLLQAPSNENFNDIIDIENAGRPFIFLGFSCHLAQFHAYQEGSSSGVESIVEQMLLLPDGRGAVAAFACAGAAQLDDNTAFNREIFKAFFEAPTPGGPPEDYFWPRWTLGSILGTGTVEHTIDEQNSRPDRTYVLLGDPLLHLELSPPSIRVTLDGDPLVHDEFIEASGGEAVVFVADIMDEVEIDPVSISVIDTGGDPGDITVQAMGDTLGELGRWYRVTYETTIQERIYDIVFQATDVTGQTSRFVVHVPEGGGLVLRDVANYPNPFYDTTRIIYVLNQSGVDVRIDIFTVGGRLIRRMEAPGQLNYNEIEWDGVDQDGDPVANGLYLYVIEARTDDGSVVTSNVGRMVVARGPRFDHLRE